MGGVGDFHHLSSLLSLLHPPTKSQLHTNPIFSGHSEDDVVLTASCIFLLAKSAEVLPKKVIYGQKETLTPKPN